MKRPLAAAVLFFLGTFTMATASGVRGTRLVRPVRRAPAVLAGLTVDGRSANPGAEGFARPQCVAARLSRNARYECGDLQVTHAAATTRTRNTARTPLLIYNSATAKPRPVVGAFVSTPSNTTADSITATLVLSGTTVATKQFAGSAWGSGGVNAAGVGRAIRCNAPVCSEHTGADTRSLRSCKM